MHTRFKKGQSGNPREPRPKNLPALLIEVRNAPVDGHVHTLITRHPGARAAPASPPRVTPVTGRDE
ncbi:MAG: hypothetical protein JOY71_24405 [Acetobacteraceae bacterium]|nr:hypothetical protein [Acetobacteraceae bacterium]